MIIMIIVIIIIKLRQIFECPPKFFQFKFPNTITYSPNKQKIVRKNEKKKNLSSITLTLQRLLSSGSQCPRQQQKKY